MLVSMLWSNVVRDCDNATASINQHILGFESEARVTIDEFTVKTITTLQNAFPIQLSGNGDLIWEVPLQRNGMFSGRNKELEDLHGKLFSQQPRGVRSLEACVIHSMGGMGKTQLALEYAYRYRSHYDYVIWFDAEQAPVLAQRFVEIGKLLGSRGLVSPHLLHSIGQSQVVQEVMRWLEHSGEFNHGFELTISTAKIVFRKEVVIDI